MKFAVDCMLGKLARWLRALGFDAVYFRRIDDDELADLARREGRILLTRDGRLLERAGDLESLAVDSENWPEQVAQVLDAFGLRRRVRPHSRCLECNRLLKRIPKERARNLVSPSVWSRAESFALCPVCGRVFWPGTHFQDMDRKLRAILEKPADSDLEKT